MVDSSNEQKYIVGWGCEIADEWLTRGARNEIHICDSNMNGSYEREAISRRYPNNEIEILSVSEVMKEFSLLGRADCSLSAQEAHGGIEPAEHSVDPLIANNQAELERGLEGKYNTNLPLSHIRNTRYTLVNDSDLSLGEVVSSIQSYPSPEFLNSLPFIKKFFPTPLWGEGYFTKTTHENSCNLRHSEAHSPSAKKLQKTRRSARLFEDTFNANENSSSRKNPAYLLHNTSKLKGIYMKNLTETVFSRFTSHFSLPKVAFTLAEVLITLGIIGVVAALSLPSVITNYQKKQTATQLKVAYQAISEAINRAKLDYGDTLDVPENVYNTVTIYTNNINLSKLYLDPYFTGAHRYSGKKINIKDKSNKGYFIIGYAGSGYGDKNPLCTTKGFCYWVINHGANYYHIIIDINGPKAPNIAGRDVFLFTLNGQYVPGKGTFTIDSPKVVNSSGNANQNECNNDIQSYWNGSSCAALIVNNNWEIPRDYPW